MSRGNLLKLLDGLVLALIALITHQTIFVWFYFYPQYNGSPETSLAVIAILALLVMAQMNFRRETKLFFLAWRRNWLLGLFILLACLSVAWTVSLPATLYRVVLTLFVTLIASYVGMRFSARDLTHFVACVVSIFALASLFLVVFFPGVGLHSEFPYAGLWRGIFWHKNYLGAEMALGYIALLAILFSPRSQSRVIQKVIAAVLVVICSILAIFANSASGLMLLVIQSGLLIAILFWLRWGHLLPRWAYGVFGGGVLLVAILIATNLSFIFGLFNRSGSMTGRVPMWLHLLKTYIFARPGFGYGFGAFWLQSGIMQKIQAVVGWAYPVRISDNGYLDITLGLGLTGLFLVLALLIIGLWRSLRSAFLERDLMAFSPFFILIHIIFINISLSYFFENEMFIWFLLVSILFLPKPQQPSASSSG